MKFLEDEWYETRVKRIDETFAEPGRLNTSLVEGYRSVWGEAGTVLLSWRFRKGMSC